MGSDELLGDVDVDDPSTRVKDDEQIGRCVHELDSHENELLFTTLVGNHRILDLAEPTGHLLDFPLVLQVSRSQLPLHVEREL